MHRLRLGYAFVAIALLIAITIPGLVSVKGVDIGSITLVNVAWSSISNPSGYKDIAYSVCGNSNWVYVVGSQQSDTASPIMRIERRSKLNGTLVSVWISANSSLGHGELYDCIAVDRHVYVVGYVVSGNETKGVLAVFDEDLNLVNKTVWEDWIKALFIDARDGYMYVAGLVYVTPSDIGWGVEKLAPNLTVVGRYISNPTTYYDHLLGFSINPVTGDLWVVGLRGDSGAWRIEVLNANLSEKSKFDYMLPGIGMPNSITFDGYGRAYIAGSSIAICNASGGIMSITSPFGYCPQIYYSDGLICLFCTAVTEGLSRLVLYAIDEESFISLVFNIDIGVNANVYIPGGKIYSDNNYIYIMGYTDAYDSGSWFIAAVKKISKTITVEQEVTLPGLNTTTVVAMNMSLKDIIHSLVQASIHSSTTLQIQTSLGFSNTIQPASSSPQQFQYLKDLVETVITALIVVVIGVALFIVFWRSKTRFTMFTMQ